jgi:hypothetical protein
LHYDALIERVYVLKEVFKEQEPIIYPSGGAKRYGFQEEEVDGEAQANPVEAEQAQEAEPATNGSEDS